MANLSKDQVLAALPSLSQADLMTLQAVINSLLGDATTAAQKAPNEPQAWLYEALTLHLGARQAYATFITTTPGKQFTKNAPVALQFIKNNFPDVLNNRTKATALMRYLATLLFSDLKARKVPITRRTVMANAHRLGEVFEAAFPEYSRSGLGWMIMNSLLKKQTGNENAK